MTYNAARICFKVFCALSMSIACYILICPPGGKTDIYFSKASIGSPVNASQGRGGRELDVFVSGKSAPAGMAGGVTLHLTAMEICFVDPSDSG